MQYCVILHIVEPQGLRFLPQSKTCKVNSPVTFPMMGALVCEWYILFSYDDCFRK